MDFQGKQVFVTGGSGFIGGRLVEILHQDLGARVRALVHNPAAALRLARHDIEFCFADMTDPLAMEVGTRGCEYIFHCAFGKSGNEAEQMRATVDGTRSLAQAALKNGASRLINLSTAAVYGETPDGVVDESHPRNAGAWHYARMKLAAEETLEEIRRREPLPHVTLQLVGVYGPWGDVFTVGPLKQLASGRVILVNNGTGLVNATYVDDVVQAMLRSAVYPEAVGQTFLIKGAGRITRRTFYEAYARMLGEGTLVGMTPDEIAHQRTLVQKENMRRLLPLAAGALRYHQGFRAAFSDSHFGRIFQTLRPRMPANWVRALKGQSKTDNNVPRSSGMTANPTDSRPLILPPEIMVHRLAAQTEFSCLKAEQLLSYSPHFDLNRGMELTERWAKWARLIPSRSSSN